MDETTEKKVRALKLKLAMVEKELHASSGKWKLGALLGAGHTAAMNREVVKLKERLESKIERLRSDLASLTGEPLPAAPIPEKSKAAQAVKVRIDEPVPAAPKPVKEVKPAAKAEVSKPAPAKKTADKKAGTVKHAAAKKAAEPAKKKEKKKSAPAKSSSKTAPAKQSGKK